MKGMQFDKLSRDYRYNQAEKWNSQFMESNFQNISVENVKQKHINWILDKQRK